ncbi:glycosyltransferase family 34 protein, partial [Ascoidea rubescens DSM 1968]
IVIILAANVEGGVNNWKRAEDWSIERTSILNKKIYSKIHGYNLIIKDFTKKKKYSNEFRESWQKFDVIRSIMKDNEFKENTWFFYLDLYSLIMEPNMSIEELIFKNLNQKSFQTLSYFNPNKIKIDIPYLSFGNNDNSDNNNNNNHIDDNISLIISQDCYGFNLNSFLIKKSNWTNLFLDLIWEPIFYKKLIDINGYLNEERILEYYYSKQSWIRNGMLFLPNKMMNSLKKLLYNWKDRDFLVNMNGCKNKFNRNCWEEMEFYNKLSKNLRLSWFKKLF